MISDIIVILTIAAVGGTDCTIIAKMTAETVRKLEIDTNGGSYRRTGAVPHPALAAGIIALQQGAPHSKRQLRVPTV